jgi:hypothetical protein
VRICVICGAYFFHHGFTQIFFTTDSHRFPQIPPLILICVNLSNLWCVFFHHGFTQIFFTTDSHRLPQIPPLILICVNLSNLWCIFFSPQIYTDFLFFSIRSANIRDICGRHFICYFTSNSKGIKQNPLAQASSL